MTCSLFSCQILASSITVSENSTLRTHLFSGIFFPLLIMHHCSVTSSLLRQSNNKSRSFLSHLSTETAEPYKLAPSARITQDPPKAIFPNHFIIHFLDGFFRSPYTYNHNFSLKFKLKGEREKETWMQYCDLSCQLGGVRGRVEVVSS